MALVPGVRPIIEVGGVVFTNLDEIKILSGETSTTGVRANLRQASGSSGYQVPVGKSFRVDAVQYIVATLSGNNVTRLAYSDNDVGMAASTAWTNPVYMGGSSSAAITWQLGQVGEFSSAVGRFSVPAQKYVGGEHSGSSAGVLHRYFGYEV